MGKTGEFIAAVGLSAAAVAGIGMLVENHTNQVADSKANTARTCLDTYPADEFGNLTQQIVDCMHERWIPGSEPIGEDKFQAKQAVGVVEGYIRIQKDEASTFDWQRVAAWALAGAAIGIVLSSSSDGESPEADDEESDTADTEPDTA